MTKPNKMIAGFFIAVLAVTGGAVYWTHHQQQVGQQQRIDGLRDALG